MCAGKNGRSPSPGTGDFFEGIIKFGAKELYEELKKCLNQSKKGIKANVKTVVEY